MRTLVRLFVFLIGLLLAAAPAVAGMGMSAGTGAHTHSDANTGGGTLAVSGTVSSTKACATGFTRVTPNFCQANLVGSASSVAACAISNPITGGSDVKAVLFRAEVILVSANSVALRAVLFQSYGPADTSCATALFREDIAAYEEVAKVLTTISRQGIYFVSRTDSSGQTYHNATLCASCTVSLYNAGYFD